MVVNVIATTPDKPSAATMAIIAVDVVFLFFASCYPLCVADNYDKLLCFYELSPDLPHYQRIF
jgi:hypothetical protein